MNANRRRTDKPHPFHAMFWLAVYAAAAVFWAWQLMK
jgi:hypothetical protein